jgi:hypothetical protein
MLDPTKQATIRDFLKAVLASHDTASWVLTNAGNTKWIDAAVLQAYSCYSGEVAGTPSWENALAAYHDGADSLAGGRSVRMDICTSPMWYPCSQTEIPLCSGRGKFQLYHAGKADLGRLRFVLRALA